MMYDECTKIIWCNQCISMKICWYEKYCKGKMEVKNETKI